MEWPKTVALYTRVPTDDPDSISRSKPSSSSYGNTPRSSAPTCTKSTLTPARAPGTGPSFRKC